MSESEYESEIESESEDETNAFYREIRKFNSFNNCEI